MRIALGAHQDIAGNWYSDTFFGKLASCFWCMSVWASGIILVAYYYVPGAWYVLLTLALSGLAGLAYKATK